MDPGEHLAEAQRLLARAETFDSDSDVTAAHTHVMIAELMTRPGFGSWVWTGSGWLKWKDG